MKFALEYFVGTARTPSGWVRSSERWTDRARAQGDMTKQIAREDDCEITPITRRVVEV